MMDARNVMHRNPNGPRAWLLLPMLAALAPVLAAAQATSTSTPREPLWEAVARLQQMVPFTEQKIEQSLGYPLDRHQQNGMEFYRGKVLQFADGSRIDEITWTPRRANRPADVVLRIPAAQPRTDACVTRSEVSRELGAPARSWTTKEGDRALTHFEFARPSVKVGVAFDDATDCATTVTVTEG